MTDQEARAAIDHYVGALDIEKRRADDAEGELARLRVDRAELADEVHALRERIARIPDRIQDAEAERDKAIAERNMAVGKVDEMRQRLADLKCQRECEALRDWDALLAERDAAVAKLDQVRTAMHEWAGSHHSGYYDEAQDDAWRVVAPILDGEAQS